MILVFSLFSHCLSQNKSLIIPVSCQDRDGGKIRKWSGLRHASLGPQRSSATSLRDIGSLICLPAQSGTGHLQGPEYSIPVSLLMFKVQVYVLSLSYMNNISPLNFSFSSVKRIPLAGLFFVCFSFSNPRHFICSKVFLQIALPQTTKSCHFSSFSFHFTCSA